MGRRGQDRLDGPVLGRVFLPCHPLDGGLRVANGRGDQIVAQAIEVGQVRDFRPPEQWQSSA